MRNFDKSIEEFLLTLQKFKGANPVFSLDYNKKVIILKDAPSGFLKLLLSSDKVCAHLSSKGVEVSYFN